jgi:hypothetical protein
MAMHDVAVGALMFRCISDGAWSELIVPRQRQDFIAGDFVCFREFDDAASRYTGAMPITFKILTVADHNSDRSTIPWGCFLIAFEPIPPAHTTPPAQYVPKSKDARVATRTTPRLTRTWPLRTYS